MSAGYVVVEWNQASEQPSVACPDVHQTEAQARDCAGVRISDTLHVGRRDRYTVAELVEVPNPCCHCGEPLHVAECVDGLNHCGDCKPRCNVCRPEIERDIL